MPSSERRHGKDGTESHGKAVLSLPTPVLGQRAWSLKLRGVPAPPCGPEWTDEPEGVSAISCVLPLPASHLSGMLCLLVDSGGTISQHRGSVFFQTGAQHPLTCSVVSEAFIINFAAERCVAPGFQRREKWGL